jgi:acetate kinase
MNMDAIIFTAGIGKNSSISQKMKSQAGISTA